MYPYGTADRDITDGRNDEVGSAMEENMMSMIRAYRDFNETGMYMALFYCSLIYLWYRDRGGQLRRMWVYPSIFFFLMIFNPLVIRYILDMVFDYASKPRVFWLFPIVCVIGIAATMLVTDCKSTKEKIILGLILCMVMVFSGKFKYTNEYLAQPTNLYDLPQEAVDIADYAMEEMDSPKLVVPIELATAMRVYTSDVRLLYGEDVVYGRIQYMGPTPYEEEKPQYTIYQCLKEEVPKVEQVIDLIKDFECDYVVFDNELQSGYEVIEDYDYQYVNTIGKYDIYQSN